MRFTSVTLFLLSATIILAIQADPLIYIKNNSDRLISVKPLTSYTQYEEKMIKPDSEEIWEYQDSSEPINGLHVRYCPGTPETNNICYNSLEGVKKFEEFKKIGLVTLFTLTAPEAKKYYLKIDIGMNNTVILKPQEGRFGMTSGTYKYSLKGNIKKNQISEARTAPTQKMSLPSEVPAPTGMPPTSPATIMQKPQPSQSQESLIREIKTIIQNGPAEFAKPVDQRKYKKAADFHSAVMDKIARVTSKKEQENLKALFGAAYAAISSNYPK